MNFKEYFNLKEGFSIINNQTIFNPGIDSAHDKFWTRTSIPHMSHSLIFDELSINLYTMFGKRDKSAKDYKIFQILKNTANSLHQAQLPYPDATFTYINNNEQRHSLRQEDYDQILTTGVANLFKNYPKFGIRSGTSLILPIQSRSFLSSDLAIRIQDYFRQPPGGMQPINLRLSLNNIIHKITTDDICLDALELNQNDWAQKYLRLNIINKQNFSDIISNIQDINMRKHMSNLLKHNFIQQLYEHFQNLNTPNRTFSINQDHPFVTVELHAPAQIITNKKKYEVHDNIIFKIDNDEHEGTIQTILNNTYNVLSDDHLYNINSNQITNIIYNPNDIIEIPIPHTSQYFQNYYKINQNALNNIIQDTGHVHTILFIDDDFSTGNTALELQRICRERHINTVFITLFGTKSFGTKSDFMYPKHR